MTFIAAADEQEFALKVCAGIEELAASNRYSHATPDLVRAIVDGIGDLAARRMGAAQQDRRSSKGRISATDGKVVLPEGFREAYQAYVEGGWNSLYGPVEYGGQDLPMSMAVSVLETLASSNMALSLNPMLSGGRDRRASPPRQRGPEGEVPPQAGLRRMVRHDEPHRAAGGDRRRRTADRSDAHRGWP